MSKAEIRWIQRFNQYQKALSQLREAVDLARQRPLTDLERHGLIQAFECTHELAWRVMKDFRRAVGRAACTAHETPRGKRFALG